MDIKFRGRSKDNGDFVYGFYSPLNVPLLGEMGHFIIPNGYRPIEVDPNTVGQYIGRYDTYGNEVYTGDIVKGYDVLNNRKFTGYVDFKDCSFVIVTDFMTHYRWMDYKIEVIGNVFQDNDFLNRG